MQRKPNEVVYAAVNALSDQLRGPLEAALLQAYGPHWPERLRTNVRRTGVTGTEHWDAAAVLHTLRETWHDVFRERFGDVGRHHAGELIDFRNRAAHASGANPISQEDAARAVDTARRLLRGMGLGLSPDLEALATHLAAPDPGTTDGPAPSPPRQVAAPRAGKVAADPDGMRGYSASRLTFKAAVIDAIRDDESFHVETPEGTFVMTRADFLREFANVAASRSYREAGVYHYPKTPERAYAFLKR